MDCIRVLADVNKSVVCFYICVPVSAKRMRAKSFFFVGIIIYKNKNDTNQGELCICIGS